VRLLRIVAINITVLIASVLILFTVIEIGSRIYLHHFADDETFMRYASYRQLQARGRGSGESVSRYVAHRYIGFIPRPDYTNGIDRHNSLGYRGEEIEMPKPAGEFRIVCMGGSTTYTAAVEDYRESYPAQLETILRERGHGNVTVVNGGSLNWTTYASLVNFQFRVLDLEPDLIIVYHAINDLMGRLIWPPSAYTGDNSGMKEPAVSQWFMPSLPEYSTAIRILLVKTGRTVPHSAGYGTINKLRSTYVGDLLKVQHAQGTYPNGLFKDHPVSEILETNPPVYFRRNLENIAVTAIHNGVVPVFATFAYSPEFPEYAWSSCAELWPGYAEMNHVIKEVAADTGSVCFDFAAEFPTAAKYYTDGTHVNAEGARLKAKLFADFLERTNLLPAG